MTEKIIGVSRQTYEYVKKSRKIKQDGEQESYDEALRRLLKIE